MKKRIQLLPLLLMLLLTVKGYSTHLMGGEISYTFAGTSGSNFLYNVNVMVYRDCNNGQAPFDNPLELGIYRDDAGNPNNKILVDAISISNPSITSVVPPNANPNCPVGNNVCVELGTYTAQISLPASSTGYHLVYERCCRNGIISNIDGSISGTAYYAFIPATQVQNTSPVFASAAVPFICTSDTVIVNNAAFDADGDSLVYSLSTPYNGTSDQVNPQPSPANNYPWPIADVVYNPTYSLSSPFGPGGFSSIDANTGLTKFLIPNQGVYVIAIEIKEYRNGVLIGITRRDFQLLGTPCLANNAPQSVGGTPTQWNTTPGSTLNFPVQFADADGDSVRVSATGLIFNPANFNPPATFTNSNGSGGATSQFSWAVPCSNSGGTYTFIATATDNGCPNKSSTVIYTIDVSPFTIGTLSGPDTVCASAAQSSSYTVNASGATSYVWTITGGTQVSGGNSNTIGVNWTSNNGSLSVYALGPNGCISDTVSKNIVRSNPRASAGIDLNLCSGDVAQLGSNPVAGQTYSWQPPTNLSSSTVANPSFSLINNTNNVIPNKYVLSVTQNGCTSSDTVFVNVGPTPAVTLGSFPSTCANGNPIALTGGSPAGGVYSGPGVTNNVFNPSVGDGVYTITYTYTNAQGCVGTATSTITVQPANNATIGSFAALCGSDSPITLTGGLPAGGSYSGTGVSNGVFDPSVSGAGTFTITYTYTNPSGCSSSAITTITVNPAPQVSLANFDIACLNGGPISLSGGTPAGGTYTGTGVSNGSFDPSVVGVGSSVITYTYSNAAGCTGSAQRTITVATPPVATVTAGQSISCRSNTIYIGYGPQSISVTANAPTAVSYQWYLDGNIISGATSATIEVTQGGNYTAIVTDANGCSSSPSDPGSIITINTEDVRCGQNLQKVVLCHVPPGNPGNPQTLCIAPSAVPAHLANHPGDCLGPCPPLRVGVPVGETSPFHVYPNPFSQSVNIEFEIFQDSKVTISLFDISGRLVRTIYSENTESDYHFNSSFNLSDLSKGVYYIRFSSVEFSAVEKLVKE